MHRAAPPALRDFWDTYRGSAPPRDTPAWERYIDEAFAHGVARLRDAGVGYIDRPKRRVAQLSGSGDHPFDAFVRTLSKQGTPVCFIPAHTEGKFAAGIIRRASGDPVLLLGRRLLLDRDPTPAFSTPPSRGAGESARLRQCRANGASIRDCVPRPSGSRRASSPRQRS